jgi:D-ribose pyranase
MKKGLILNQGVNEVISSMGHGDKLIVCDAGFPIPRESWRVDLAIARDFPDLTPFLRILMQDFIAEKVIFGEEVRDYNPPLYNELLDIFDGIEIELVPHKIIIEEMKHQAKAIIRTGAFNPWGNIVLVSSPDVPKWFEREGTLVPEWYKSRATKGGQKK